MTAFYSQMRTISQDQKKAFGEKLTSLKEELNRYFEEKEKELKEKELNKRLAKEKVDITLPGYVENLGSKHPFYAVVDDITDFFVGMGFTVADGPEVESDRNNFELMNIPADHPARDMQDSFSIDPTTVLRSHTSCVQARVMQQMQEKDLSKSFALVRSTAETMMPLTVTSSVRLKDLSSRRIAHSATF